MVLCRFFQSGYCKFGDTCRFEHSTRVGGYGGVGGGGGGEHYGSPGRSDGYNSPARYGQSPTRYGNYDNRNDSRGGYRSDYRNDQRTDYRNDQRTDYRNDQRTDYRNDQRTDYRNDNQSNNVHDSRNRNRSDFRSENRFTVLNDQYDGSRQHDTYQRGGGGRQYDARYSYRSDQHKKEEGDGEELTPAEILDGIAEDMELWETGKMWLFSCFGYAREIKSFPGLDDLSADEVRLKAYEANASGTMVAHVNWLSHLVKDYQAKRSALRKPDANERSALLNLIENIKKSSSQDASGTTRLFTSETNSYGTVTPAANIFGAATQPTNAFGAATPTNAFGAATPTNAFGAATPTNAFGAATPTNAFPSYAGTLPSSGFSMTTSTPVVPTPANAFSFGASAPQNTSGFLSALNAGSSNTTNTQSASQQNVSSLKLLGLYTPVVELTAEEKAEFENAKFTLDRVPLRPPPKNLI